MLANFHMCGIMLVLRAVFNLLVRNASPRGPMCFRCLMLNLSGPCELLFLPCFIVSWTRVVVSVMLCYVLVFFGVSLLMYLFVLFVACLTVFVNCLVKQFAMCLGVVAVLLLDVMDVFIVVLQHRYTLSVLFITERIRHCWRTFLNMWYYRSLWFC